MIDTLFAGRWRIEEAIAAGASGSVWRALDLVLDRRVAVKVLHADVAARPQAPERFRREALMLARLRHPNAVEIYDHGVDAGRLYIAMELVLGTSLDRVLAAAGGRFPAARAVSLLTPVLDVLDCAHALGIVHRDLKPANVIVQTSPEGTEWPRVVDFGLAMVLEDGPSGRLTLLGHMHGTPAYMPPEQCLGRAIEARSDLYAAGCCLYELLTGAPPFGDGDPAQVIAAQIHQVPVPPGRLDPPVEVPAALEEVLLASLAKLPSRRPESARVMKEALLAALDEEGAGSPARSVRAARPGAGSPDAAGGAAPAHSARAVGVVEPPAAGAHGVSAALGVAGFAVEPLGAAGFVADPPDHDGDAASLGAIVVVPSPGAPDPVAAAARWVRPGGPPVLLCGAASDAALLARAIEAGLYDYVLLPLDSAELVTKVTRAVRGKR